MPLMLELANARSSDDESKSAFKTSSSEVWIMKFMNLQMSLYKDKIITYLKKLPNHLNTE